MFTITGMSVVAQYNQSGAYMRFLRVDVLTGVGEPGSLHAGMAGLKL
ncbi:MAG: hypothetical protein KAJ06_07970 [Gammaproteobacteria bacterium]|nr:hypothetical protein [Gammaproteobacteria bacterium]